MAMTNTLGGVQAAIKTALEAITTVGSAYNFDIDKCLWGSPNLDEVVGGRTQIFIADITEEEISTSGGVDVMRATYTIVSVLQTDAANTGGDHGIDATKLAADIHKSLTTDVTLGTVVYMTRKESTSISYYNKGDKAVITQVFYSDYPSTIGAP